MTLQPTLNDSKADLVIESCMQDGRYWFKPQKHFKCPWISAVLSLILMKLERRCGAVCSSTGTTSLRSKMESRTRSFLVVLSGLRLCRLFYISRTVNTFQILNCKNWQISSICERYTKLLRICSLVQPRPDPSNLLRHHLLWYGECIASQFL